MDQQITKTQVIIVGAGPTGLSMAVQLLRYNIDFIIIEKNEKTTPLSKAVVVQARTLEIFQEIGLAEKAIKQGQITTGLNLFYKGKQKAKVNIVGLGEGLSPYPFALSLEQSKTEQLLIDHLAENNKAILWNSHFTRFEQHNNVVTVYFNDAQGHEQQIEAQYLVGCDGASSPIRHQMGLSFEGDTVPKMFYVADVKLKSATISRNELFMFMIEKGFILFFPMEGEGHYRVIGILPETKDVDANYKFADIVDDIKKQLVIDADFQEVYWFSSYKVHSRKASSFENKNCFIAGDAAHIHTPAGGQGMNTGIQDAYNLAWKIAYVLKGEVNASILKTYNVERSENARHLLKSTDTMFEVMAGTSRFWNFIRLNIIPKIIGFLTSNPAIKKRIFPLISQTGIRYSANDLIIDSSISKVRAGVRMPHFIFSDGKQIFDYLSDPIFKLLFFGNDNNNCSRQICYLKIKMVTYAFEEIPTALFGKHINFYILLRPDNHISYIGQDLNKCREILDRIT